MIIGGVVPVVQRQGRRARSADARRRHGRRDLLGEITKWNDAAIKKLNPRLTLPDHGDRAGVPLGRLGHQLPVLRLPVQGRARSSRTRSAPTPRCSGRSASARKGNEGVANMTTQTDGAIGYVEYAYAKQNKMAYAQLQNQRRQDRRAERRELPGGRGQRRLGARAGLLPHPDRPAGRGQLADHRRELHPGLRHAAGPGRDRRRAQVLRLGVQERWQDGGRARLRAAAGQR